MVHVVVSANVDFSRFDFTLPDHLGGKFRLADRRGKGPTILIFYRGHWCPYCARYFVKKIQPNLARLTAAGGMVLGIGPEPVHTASDFARTHGLTFPLLCDFDGLVIQQFGVRNGFSAAQSFLPHPGTFIFDPDLQLRFRAVDRNFKKRTTIVTIFDALDAMRQPAAV